jgi:hypothetical protein
MIQHHYFQMQQQIDYFLYTCLFVCVNYNFSIGHYIPSLNEKNRLIYVVDTVSGRKRFSRPLFGLLLRSNTVYNNYEYMLAEANWLYIEVGFFSRGPSSLGAPQPS